MDMMESTHVGAINCDKQNDKSLIIGIQGRNPMDGTKDIKKMRLDEFHILDRMKWYYQQKDAKVYCN